MSRSLSVVTFFFRRCMNQQSMLVLRIGIYNLTHPDS